ncbi:MAG TPA: DUF2914 domain-containing protein [Candidatus Polarisedimenticolia bacterium]|jgi:hypothetical protein|nr:DUF2914 domain-containing protein [Candidatus Polarisedimenticolia bacterium]
MDATESKPAGRLQRLQSYREEHALAEIAIFFAAGMLFDIVTLSRIDDVLSLVQQGVYLVLLAGLMVLEERERAKSWKPSGLLATAWRFSEDVIHFLLGSLLSSFTLLYLKSSSGLSALGFMAILGGLLVANELPRFREKGPIVRHALLSLCMTSYGAVLLPVVFGFISPWLFVAAVVLSCVAFWGLTRRLVRHTGDARAASSRVAAPAFAIQGLLVAAYFFGAIPPVPLSLQYIGIYHEVVPPGRVPKSNGTATAKTAAMATGVTPVEASVAPRLQTSMFTGASPKSARTYELKHLRPWWKFWQHGDQDFAARPGDVIYCFARVFAPNGFKDAIFVHWWMQGPDGWIDQGRAKLDISGGRDRGFRAFATKKNYQPGRWRVEVETTDGRDLGVIKFDLFADDTQGEREFQTDRL